MLMNLRLRTASVLTAVAVLAACGEGAPGAAETAKSSEAAKPAAAASGKWLETITATPEGGFRIGNPDAPVKLVEFASLTCPHCRDFHELAMPTLKGQYIATGQVSYEFRNFILNPADYAATMLARCSTPNAFFALSEAFFRQQNDWIQPFASLSAEQSKQLEGLSGDQQVVAYARLGKLDEFVRARGVPASKFEACLTDAGQRQQLEAIRKAAVDTYKIRGTPSFVINGELQENVFSWADLEPKLKEAIG
jgi:protein-disulfide isomerase